MSKKNIALITGSSRGIGFAIAKALDQCGIATILTGRSQAGLDAALTQLSSKTHVAVSVDFSKEKAIDDFLEKLFEEKRLPNIVIHTIGGKIAGDSFPLTNDILRASLNMNLEVALKINEKLLPQMLQENFGRIIHISSDASLTGQASPAYVIAKSALNGYVKSAARFYAKHGVMLCAVLPGILDHAGSAWAEKKVMQPEYYQKKMSQMPLGRFGKPEEIASFVAELATSDNMMCAGGLFELCGAVN